MSDDTPPERRAAVLLIPGSPPLDARVPIIAGKPPAEFGRRRADGNSDRFRLVRDDDACAVYEYVGTVAGS
jgi:hypothetical protein